VPFGAGILGTAVLGASLGILGTAVFGLAESPSGGAFFLSPKEIIQFFKGGLYIGIIIGRFLGGPLKDAGILVIEIAFDNCADTIKKPHDALLYFGADFYSIPARVDAGPFLIYTDGIIQKRAP
jgi:hypothetical protein